jgi:hypothetical protein
MLCQCPPCNPGILMLQLADWQTYLAVQAGAAATLTGLVFVAVSINLAQIISVPGLPGRAFEALLQLLQVFFVASFALLPHQTAPLLGGEILSITVVSLIGQFVSQARYAKVRTSAHPRHWLYSRTIMGLIATLPLCACGVMLLLRDGAWTGTLVAGIVLSFVAGIMGAWVLLIEILR